jgi:iron(III) transport system ATP-binding protein
MPSTGANPFADPVPARNPADFRPIAPAPGPSAPLIAMQAVSLRYGAKPALVDVSLEVHEGELLCLLGPSGSGKSSLLRIVAGVERPSGGRLRFDGREVAGPDVFVEPERRRVGMVFQDYALFPHLTVAANVAFGVRGLGRKEADRTVADLLARVGLERHGASYPHMLSGGERQRVALVRALAPGPRVLLLDEPFSNLDGRLRDHVRQQTLDLLRDMGTTTIFVTHDPAEAMRIGNRIALLRNGRLLQCGRPEDLYSRPTTRFAARFFGDVNEIAATCRGGAVETPFGTFATHLAERAPASVCIRPEHVHVAVGPSGVAARVLRIDFLGEIDHLELAVTHLDAPVTLRAFGRTRLVPGDTVNLDVDARDVLVLPRDDN